MAKNYDRHHLTPPHFKIGDYVWLLQRNIKTSHPSDKFDYRCLGPFKILDLREKSSFLLKLPSSLSRLHPVFHVSLLEPFIDPNNVPDRISEPIVHNMKFPNNPTFEFQPFSILERSVVIMTILYIGKILPTPKIPGFPSPTFLTLFSTFLTNSIVAILLVPTLLASCFP